MKSNINIYPVLATWKKSKKDGKCPIHICVNVDNARIAYPSTKRKVLEQDWDEREKKVKSSVPNADLINATIRKYISDLESELMAKQLMGHRLSKEVVKRQVKTGKNSKDFYLFCEEQIKISRYSKNSYRTAVSEITKMKQFMPSLCFGDLDYEFFLRYENYMRDTLANHNNTIWKSFKFMNTMLNRALKIGGIIIANPLRDYEKVRYKQSIPPYLEWNEVVKIKDLLINDLLLSPKTKSVGYYFLLSCTSGLRFGDAIRFSYDKFVVEDNNGKRLVLSTKKTGEIVSILFTKDITEVVEYLKDNPLHLTNQEFNRELKILGGLARLSKPLKSHMARHTFAMRCAELGMSEDDVQRLLGHSNKETTKIYFRIKNRRLDDAMRLWDK